MPYRFARRLMILVLTPILAASAAQAFEIGRFHQPGDGSVNSWLLVGDEGVVVIDTQRSLSAGRALSDRIAATGVPLRAVLLTHPHPDHFGGLASVLDAFPGTPVYASRGTTDIMRTDANGFVAATRQVLGDDAPAEQPLPTDTFADGDTLSFGDIVLSTNEVGQGEADAATVFYSADQNVLFIGDVADNARTGFVMEGHSASWLNQIADVKDTYATQNPTLYPGHGAAGDMWLLDAQIEWIEALRALVRARLSGGIDAAESDRIVAVMKGRYPDHPAVAAVPDLMAENVKAVAAEMAAE